MTLLRNPFAAVTVAVTYVSLLWYLALMGRLDESARIERLFTGTDQAGGGAAGRGWRASRRPSISSQLGVSRTSPKDDSAALTALGCHTVRLGPEYWQHFLREQRHAALRVFG